MRISPYIQGNCDSLCGIYSIINAAKLANNISGEEAIKMFGKCLRYLENYKSLSKVSTEGINTGDLWKILNEKLTHYSIQADRPFYRKRKISTDEYFDTLREYFKEGENRSAIISIESHDWDHWTVARAVTTKSLLLCDSSDIKTVSISKCTFKRITKRKPFLINPNDTFYVYQKEK